MTPRIPSTTRARLDAEPGAAPPQIPPAGCCFRSPPAAPKSVHSTSFQLQSERQCRCKLKSLGILSCRSLELFHSLHSHVGCRIALKFDNKFFPLLDTQATVRGGAIPCCQTFGLLGIFANLLIFSRSLQKGLTERSMKEYLHIVHLIIRRAVICLNLGKSQSKLFKEIAHIFEASSGVIKIEIMYIGPIVV